MAILRWYGLACLLCGPVLGYIFYPLVRYWYTFEQPGWDWLVVAALLLAGAFAMRPLIALGGLVALSLGAFR